MSSTALISQNAMVKNTIFPQMQGQKNKLTEKTGDLITALITSKENGKVNLKTTLKSGVETTLQFDEDKVAGEVGDKVYFEVTKATDSEFSLKQVFPKEKTLQKQYTFKNIKDLMIQNDWVHPEEGVLSTKSFQESNNDIQAKTMRAMQKIRREMAYSADNITTSAINELLSSGISINRISFQTLSSVVQEIVESPQKVESQKHIDGNSNAHSFSQSQRKEMEKASARLENITSGLSDSTIAQLLKSDAPLTIDHIYITKYSSSKTADTTQSIDQATFEHLMPEIAKFFEREGIEINDETLGYAKFLLENGIDLHKENIEKLRFLKNIDADKTETLNNALVLMQNGRNAGAVVLFGPGKTDWHNQANELKTTYAELLQDLPRFTPVHIDLLIQQSKPLTLRELQKLSKQPEQTSLKETTDTEITDAETTKAVTAKRQLAEIQLKFTAEAAARLANKNIRIDTTTLQETVNHLRALESEKHARVLKSAGTFTSENNTRMNSLFQQIQGMVPLSAIVFQEIMTNKTEFSIQGISAANQAAAALSKYEDQSTVPSAKYGDSFKKVQEQFSHLLSELDIEPTEQNIRAAKILSRNNMDLTEEALIDVKLIDAKVSDISTRLNPYIAAEMIKKGLNPSTMNIDEVIQYINQFEQTYGETTKEKIARYISNMERSREFNTDERNAVIAVYRMLNSIQKSDSAAIGLGVRLGNNATLGSLYEASKYYKKSNSGASAIDTRLDDATPYTHSLESETSVSSLLSKTSAYHKHISREIINNASPKTLNRFIQESLGYLEQNLETTLNQLKDIQDQSEKDQSIRESELNQTLEQIQTLRNTPQNILQFMYDNNIEITMANITVMNSLSKNRSFLKDELNALEDLISQDATSGISLHDLLQDTGLSELSQRSPWETLAQLETSLESLDTDVSNTEATYKIRDIQNTVAILSQLSKNTGTHQVPLLFNGKISDIDLYVMNQNLDTKEDVRAFASLDAGRLGQVQLLIDTAGSGVSLTIAGESKASLKAMQSNEGALRDYVAAAGYDLNEVRYRLSSHTAEAFEFEPASKHNTRFNRNTISSEFEALI